MEDLNKNQIVLLTLLVSFVTSIATGIMTVSLLQEAPLEVTRNINRIVEKTIETVTPGVTITEPAQKEITTVIVKEEDLIVEAINKNLKSIVRIKERDPVLEISSFYGIGLVVNKDGFIATDRKTVTSANIYTAVTSDGTELSLSPTGIDKQTNFILFKASEIDKTDKATTTKSYVFVPTVLTNTDPKLGQTIIALGGNVSNTVSVGRVAALEMKDSGTGTSTIKFISSIDTDVSIKDPVDGSPAFNLSGDVVGVRLSLDGARSFTPISLLKKELAVLLEVLEAPKSETSKTQ